MNAVTDTNLGSKSKMCKKKGKEYLSNPINSGTEISLFLKVAWK